MRKSVLWVVPKWPLPARDGARLATRSLLRALGPTLDIDLLALVPKSESVDEDSARRELGVRRSLVVRHEAGRRPWQLAGQWLRRPTVPLTAAAFGTPVVARSIESQLAGEKYDWLVFDGLHGAAAFSSWGKLRAPECARGVIYRAHNVERDLWSRAIAVEKKLWKRTIFRTQENQIARLEESLTRQARVAAISDQDAAEFLRWNPKAVVSKVPVGVPFTDEPPVRVANANPEFLYCGLLDWAPNRQGLEWLLREVWPEVSRRRPQARLTIIGKGNSRWIAPYAGAGAGVRLVGEVPETLPYFDAADALLVPVFIGSGVRVKMIEAAARALVCIATPRGAQGTGFSPEREYLSASDREQWIARLVDFESARELAKGRAAFHKVRDEFDERTAAARFLELMGERS